MRIIFGSVNLLTILFFDVVRHVTFRMHDENKRALRLGGQVKIY